MNDITDKTKKLSDKDAEYGKEYYKKNSKAILTKMLAKEECEHCHRIVAHQQMYKHQETKFCKKRKSKQFELLAEMKKHYQNAGVKSEDEIIM